jgi:hypothetical protein
MCTFQNEKEIRVIEKNTAVFRMSPYTLSAGAAFTWLRAEGFEPFATGDGGILFHAHHFTMFLEHNDLEPELFRISALFLDEYDTSDVVASEAFEYLASKVSAHVTGAKCIALNGEVKVVVEGYYFQPADFMLALEDLILTAEHAALAYSETARERSAKALAMDVITRMRNA